MKTQKMRMTDLGRIWDEHDGNKFFTIGRGKADYCLWTCGPCGLHYCYRVGADGMAYGRRAVEPTAEITLHYEKESSL